MSAHHSNFDNQKSTRHACIPTQTEKDHGQLLIESALHSYSESDITDGQNQHKNTEQAFCKAALLSSCSLDTCLHVLGVPMLLPGNETEEARSPGAEWWPLSHLDAAQLPSERAPLPLPSLCFKRTPPGPREQSKEELDVNLNRPFEIINLKQLLPSEKLCFCTSDIKALYQLNLYSFYSHRILYLTIIKKGFCLQNFRCKPESFCLSFTFSRHVKKCLQ